jgi:hypothetical protein
MAVSAASNNPVTPIAFSGKNKKRWVASAHGFLALAALGLLAAP